MKIVTMATSLNQLKDEIDYLKMDLFSDEKEIEKKEEEKKVLLNKLLFYNEFEFLYKCNQKYELDSRLLYPFKEIINDLGEKEFVRKNNQEYKEDVDIYLEKLANAFKEGKIDKNSYNKMKEEAIELANKQIDRIDEEEKKQEEAVDLNQDYNKILNDIEDTKHAFIVNEIGEDSYSSLCYKYKNMQEIERKELLYKTHTGLCKNMGISFNIDFTKYDIKDNKTVNGEGYYIKAKDINSIPYPLDTIILEQTYKLHIGQVLKNNNYTLKQKEDLTKLLYNSLSMQKELIQDKIKKRELTPYGC